MANVVPVPSDVRIQGGTVTQQIQFGDAMNPGDFLYISTVNGKAYKSANADQGEAYISGVAVSIAGADEYGFAFTGNSQSIDLGVDSVPGELYVVSDVSGQVMPYGDLTTGDWICYAAIGTADLKFELFNNPLALQKV